MENENIFAVLAFDCSGSISNKRTAKIYWPRLIDLFKTLCNKYNRDKVIIICWNDEAKQMTFDEFEKWTQEERTRGGTYPEVIWRLLESVLNRGRNNAKYDLYVTTDGEMDNNERYIEAFHKMTTKPEKTAFYFWGYDEHMNLSFLDGIPPPVVYFLYAYDRNSDLYEHEGIKLDSDALFKELTELPEYKIIKEGPSEEALNFNVLSNLYIALYRKMATYGRSEINGPVGNVIKKFVDEINGNVRGWLLKQIDFKPSGFDSEFKDWQQNIDNIVKNFLALLENVTVGFSGQAILNRIINLANGQITIDRALATYGNSSYDRMKSELSQVSRAKTTVELKSKQTDSDTEDDDVVTNAESNENMVVDTFVSSMKAMFSSDKISNQQSVNIKDKLKIVYEQTNNTAATKEQLKRIENVNFVQCPILLFDATEYSSFLVTWIGADDKTFDSSNVDISFVGDGPNGNLLRFNKKEALNIRRTLVRHPSNIFQALPVAHLNRRLPPANQQISIDAFLGLEASTIMELGEKKYKKVFESPLHMTKCYGLILYNISSNTIKLDDPMQESELNIMIHNCSTLAWLLFGDGIFVGSYSLLIVFFLYILYQTEKIKHENVSKDNMSDHISTLTRLITDQDIGIQESYLQKCIKFTIQRLTRILKCKLMFFSGMEPNLKVTMINAFIFHTQIFFNKAEMIKKKLVSQSYESLNSLRKMGYDCVQFVNLSEQILGLEFKYKKFIGSWLFWNYMCKSDVPFHYKRTHFIQIALTKQQNWAKINTKNVKIILLEGRNTKKPYLEYLDLMSIEQIYQLIELYEQHKTSPKLLQNLLEANSIKIQDIIPKVVEKIPVNPCFEKCNKLCKPIGAMPILCPNTKILALECYERVQFNVTKFGYPESSIHGHSYMKACKKLILKKSIGDEMCLPSLQELMEYIAEETPLCVYENMVALTKVLEQIIKMYGDYKKWLETASAEELKKGLWLLPEEKRNAKNWREIWKLIKLAENEKLRECTCDAHTVC